MKQSINSIVKQYKKALHMSYMLKIMEIVAEQAEINNGYENWKKNSMVPVNSVEGLAKVYGIGCVNCFKNIKNKVIAITESKKTEIADQNRAAAVSTWYIEPDCLDRYWEIYKAVKKANTTYH